MSKNFCVSTYYEFSLEENPGFYVFNYLSRFIQVCRAENGRQPLSRIVSIPSSKINPYRIVIIMRLFILAGFLRFRILNPVTDAYGLWLTSVICEIWFAFSWILDQFPKWLPVDRETYLDRLSLRSGHQS
jgi:hypothetical protein